MTDSTAKTPDGIATSSQLAIGRWLLAGAFLIPLGIGLSAWILGRPWLSSDTATGLLAWLDWRAGGPWNCIMAPDPANLAHNVPQWVSWWSPGQYAWLGSFMSMGLSVGGAMVISAVIASWVRSTGLYFLLRRFGCSSGASGLAALVEAGNWQLFYSFGMYTGGEVLQAAWLPWLLLALEALRRRSPIWWLFALPVLFFASVFAKHSMWFVVVGGAAWLFMDAWRSQPRTWTRWLSRGIILAFSIAVVRFLSNHWLTQGGPTPGTLSPAFHPTLISTAYPVAAPFLGATGISSIFGRIFLLRGLTAESGWKQFLPVLFALAAVAATAYLLVLQKLPHRSLARLLGLLLAVYISGFMVLYAGGASVSLEDRHFRPVAILLIAALAVLICDTISLTRSWQYSLRALAFSMVFYGLATSAQRIWHLHAMNHVGQAGFTLPDTSPTVIAEIRRLDKTTATRGGIMFFPEPTLCLEAPLCRKISTDAMARPMPWFTERSWRGRVPSLTVMIPESWSNDPRLTALLACFVDYAPGEWRRRTIDGWLFITAEAPTSYAYSSLSYR